MTWERALEVDARLAAKNAVLIRAALRQAIDPERIYQGYLNTTPDDSLTLPQQRVRARAWAVVNVRVNLEPLKEVIYRLWAQGYALGDTAAREAMQEARLVKKADTQGIVDWSKWKPGDAVAALLLKPPRAFQQLLQNQGITFKNFSDTTLTDIGNSVGEAIYLGLSAKQSARLIGNHVANPARALSIAITEQNRAISQATVNRYRESGLQQQEWLVFEPCNICAKNANVKVNIGAPFPSGDTQPPAHPHCRCALAPVIPGFDDPANTAGNVTQPFMPTDENMNQVSFAGRNIENELASLFKTTNVGTLENKQIAEQIMAMEAKDKAMGGSAGDAYLTIIAEKQKFTGKPVLVETIEELKTKEKAGQGTLLWRGISDFSKDVEDGILEANPKITYTAKKAVEDFMTGEYRSGWGSFGSGTYTTTDLNMAKQYAAGVSEGQMGNGQVIAMLMPQNAIMPTKEVVRATFKEIMDKPAFDSGYNIGRALAAKGYQAYDVGFLQEDKVGIYVILDRSMLTVAKETR